MDLLKFGFVKQKSTVISGRFLLSLWFRNARSAVVYSPLSAVDFYSILDLNVDVDSVVEAAVEASAASTSDISMGDIEISRRLGSDIPCDK